MPEQLQKILDKVLEWWKKFNNKQRVLILSSIGVVIIALVILGFVMATPSMKTLYICEDYKEAAQIKEILEADGTITYDTIDGGLIFRVASEDEAAACMLLGSNEFPTEPYNINNVVDGSFTRTEADKQKLYADYCEQKFAAHISQLAYVNSCTLDIQMPEDDGTILAREQEATAAVYLDTSSDVDSEQAYALAQFVAAQLGNKSTEGITIMDMNGYMIYSGADADSNIGVVSTQLSYMQKLENLVKAEISDILVGSKLFANVEVAVNMDVDFSETVKHNTQLGIPNGMTGGAITSQSLYSYESTIGTEGGVPGTDTNDDTTYVFQDGETGYTVIEESDTIYEYDKFVTTITDKGGNIKYDNCSTTVIATKQIVYDEAMLRASGQLDDMTFEEFKATHSEKNVVAVDDMYIQMIAKATGFPADQITFVCHEVPHFVEEADDGRTLTDYAQIIITVLIFVVLGYVVFRSTRAQKEEDMEPELSVETLLEATAEAQEPLEDIGYNEKSDVRIMIEKFVDENPDAVAQLLRNWLNEDWE
ncbi:MAG: flagellar biosynthesis protein [Agathobacter sp.]|nr:flagellar biosynthesis protein [Agathobacter sp.]